MLQDMTGVGDHLDGVGGQQQIGALQANPYGGVSGRLPIGRTGQMVGIGPRRADDYERHGAERWSAAGGDPAGFEVDKVPRLRPELAGGRVSGGHALREQHAADSGAVSRHEGARNQTTKGVTQHDERAPFICRLKR